MIKINDSRYIDEPVINVLKKIRHDTSDMGDMFLRDIIHRSGNLVVTCPFHGDHNEKKPACTVFLGEHGGFEEGDYHCFVCNAHGKMYQLVAGCFEKTEEFGKSWLLENFGNTFVERELYLPKISLDRHAQGRIVGTMDESILNNLVPHHPYMEKRKLAPEVCERFKVGYEPSSRCLVFPVWDENGKLHMLTKRSVIDKYFFIDEDKEKPIYLMNHIKDKDIKSVIVVESQINALTCYSYGVPAIATFGVMVSPQQFESLNRSGIRHYILAFDGDTAGDRGTARFIKNIRKDVFISVLNIPRGKDVNDLSKEEFVTLINESGLDYQSLADSYISKISETSKN